MPPRKHILPSLAKQICRTLWLQAHGGLGRTVPVALHLA
jgi:hypothetical protein